MIVGPTPPQEIADDVHGAAVRFIRDGDSGWTPFDEISETAAYLGDAKYFMVKNFINNTHYFQWDEQTCAAYFKKVKDAVEITIPKLNEMACEQVDLASVPYLSFITNRKLSGDAASYSFVLRRYVRHWLGNVWAEYDRIKLTDLVAARAQTESIQRAAAG